MAWFMVIAAWLERGEYSAGGFDCQLNFRRTGKFRLGGHCQQRSNRAGGDFLQKQPISQWSRHIARKNRLWR